jgi:hypothetical protein
LISKIARGWINEDVKQLDAPVLNMSNVRARDGHGTIGRTRSPEQSCGAIVANSTSGHGEDEIRRQAME